MRLSRSLVLLCVCVAASAQVTVTQLPDRVHVIIDKGQPTDFIFGAGVTKPYLYPLRSAAGRVISRGWPMDPRAGERHDHIHHRGVWFAHSNVNGIDFWNSDPSYHNEHMGHIVVTKISQARSGKKSGAISAVLEWQDPANKVLIDEQRNMLFRVGSPRVIDYDIGLKARERVTFGDDKDGVFGMRLAPELEEPGKDAPSSPVRTGVITSSTGCLHESGCWGKRADWTDVSGQIDGKPVGVAVLDHPENPRHPTYWHVRGYGLLAANIFGVKAFTNVATNDGSLTLAPGETLRFRYRIVIHDGDAQAAELDRLYRAYSAGSHIGLR